MSQNKWSLPPREEHPCPSLYDYELYQPDTQGPSAVNLARLDELLREVWSTEEKTTEEAEVLQRFIERCGLDPRMVVQREVVICEELGIPQEREDVPVRVLLDTSQPVQPDCVSYFRLLLRNLKPNRFPECRVAFDPIGFVVNRNPEFKPLPASGARGEAWFELHYRAPAEAATTSMGLSIALRDHHNRWRAYRLVQRVPLSFREQQQHGQRSLRIEARDGALINLDAIDPADETTISAEDGSLVNLRGRTSSPSGQRVHTPVLEGDKAIFLPLELELDWEHTKALEPLQTQPPDTPDILRPTPASRATLSCPPDIKGLPRRIELYSEPLIILGRNGGVADLPLELEAPELALHISRMQGALLATAQGLAYLATGTHPDQHNGELLPPGHWQALEDEAHLELARGMLGYKLALPHSRREQGDDHPQLAKAYQNVAASLAAERDADDRAAARRHALQAWEALQAERKRHQGRLRSVLSYARLYRTGKLRHSVAHIFLPHVLPIGTAGDMGLRIEAEGIEPFHAELEYRECGYWINNRAEDGAVRVNAQSLNKNHTHPLRAGDRIHLANIELTVTFS